MAKKPVSYYIFIIAICMSFVLVSSALLTSDMLLAMLLTGVLFLTMILSIVGFALGLKYNSTDLKLLSYNKIGTIGNIALVIIIAVLLFLALF